jgi:hypothetical protein
MSLLHPSRTGSAITVWLVNGRPARVVHDGTRYRVTDRPTRLEDENPELAYRLGLSGWRFQGTDEQGLSHMFDIRRNSDDWSLIRVYD